MFTNIIIYVNTYKHYLREYLQRAKIIYAEIYGRSYR